MTARNRPRLNQPKDVVIQNALRAGCWDQANTLLRDLYLAKGVSGVRLADANRDNALAAAANLHDFTALLGYDFAGYIRGVASMEELYRPHVDEAIALVQEMDRCVAQPRKGRAA